VCANILGACVRACVRLRVRSSNGNLVLRGGRADWVTRKSQVSLFLLSPTTCRCRVHTFIYSVLQSCLLLTRAHTHMQHAHTTPAQSLNVGALEHHISEKLADVCTFSSIYTHKPFFRECENIMEEYEEVLCVCVLCVNLFCLSVSPNLVHAPNIVLITAAAP